MSLLVSANGIPRLPDVFNLADGKASDDLIPQMHNKIYATPPAPLCAKDGLFSITQID